MHDLPAELFAHRTLDAFEQVYTAMPLDNYLWYSGHFMQQAQALYAALGTEALGLLWQHLVLANVRDVDDRELAGVLARYPTLARMLVTPT